MWVRFKSRGKWDSPTWIIADQPNLVLLRRAVHEEWLRWRERTPEVKRIGFVPRTFASSVLDENKERFIDGKLPIGADRIMLTYALYLRIQVAEGSWHDGPTGKWTTLPNVYEET